MICREGFEIFGFFIYWYAVLIALGVGTALFVSMRREQKLGFKKDTSLDLVLVCVPAGIIGARLYYVALKPELFNSIWEVLDLRSGGLAIYGGILAGGAAGLIFAKARRLSFVGLCDLAAPGLALAQAIGRWGNFFNQEAYGVQMQHLTFFPFAVYIEKESAWFAATFFYESLTCALIAFVILYKWDKFTEKGAAARFYLSSYACERCIVEGLRTDSLYLLGFRASQLLSAAVLIIAAFRTDKKPLAAAASAVLLAGIILKWLWLVATAALVLYIISSRKTFRRSTD